MKRAVVDIGTNSTRLYIADVTDRISRIEKHTIITRLGRGVDKDRRLSYDSMMRNLDALKQYKRIAGSMGITEIKGIATSAVRDAENRDEFIETIRETVGMDIKVISGEEEAELGFLGASSELHEGSALVIDIGGGSTEFIYGVEGRIILLDSLDIGAVRMTERYLSSGLISAEAINRAYEFIRGKVRGVIEKIVPYGRPEIVGIGGTITTLAAVDQELKVYDIDRVHGYRLNRDHVESILQKFVGMELEDRKHIYGLQPERADIIPAGTLILKTIMDEMESKHVIVSECDNLDGFMIKTYIV